MTEKMKKVTPPYATFPSFLNFINKLRDTSVPSRIDPSVFGNASVSLSYSVIAALKALKLIDAEGKPSNHFISLVGADDDDRKIILLGILQAGYPILFDGSLDIQNATAGQFDERIREEYGAAGSTIDKVASFFIAAAKFSDLAISPLLAARKPIASSNSSSKSRRQRKAEHTNVDGPIAPSPSSMPVAKITEKALEYRLVDLMSDAAGNPEVMSAIITVITFLKTKDTPQNDNGDQSDD